jgi:hypothetical protein
VAALAQGHSAWELDLFLGCMPVLRHTGIVIVLLKTIATVYTLTALSACLYTSISETEGPITIWSRTSTGNGAAHCYYQGFLADISPLQTPRADFPRSCQTSHASFSASKHCGSQNIVLSTTTSGGVQAVSGRIDTFPASERDLDIGPIVFWLISSVAQGFFESRQY